MSKFKNLTYLDLNYCCNYFPNFLEKQLWPHNIEHIQCRDSWASGDIDFGNSPSNLTRLAATGGEYSFVNFEGLNSFAAI